MGGNGKILRAIFFATSVCLLAGLVDVEQGFSYEFLYWDHGAVGYDAAVIHTELEEKPLILYFQIPGQKLCEKMNEEYFASAEVERYLMDMYKVEINPKVGVEEASIAKRFGVEEYPTLLVHMPAFKMKPERVQPFSAKLNLSVDEFLLAIGEKISHLYSTKAHSYYKSKQFEKSLKYYKLALKHDPGRVYTYFAIAINYHNLGLAEKNYRTLQRAEENLLKALKLDPKHAESKQELKSVRTNMEIQKGK